MSEWIKCSEQLPKIGEDVLVIDQYGDMETALFSRGLGNHLMFFTLGGTIDATHWQPLPEPPQ